MNINILCFVFAFFIYNCGCASISRFGLLGGFKPGRPYGLEVVKGNGLFTKNLSPYQRILHEAGFNRHKPAANSDPEFVSEFCQIVKNDVDSLLTAVDVSAREGQQQLSKLLLDRLVQEKRREDEPYTRFDTNNNFGCAPKSVYLQLLALACRKNQFAAFEQLMRVPELTFSDRVEAFKMALGSLSFAEEAINQVFFEGESGQALLDVITSQDLEKQLTLLILSVHYGRYLVFKHIIKTYAKSGQTYSRLEDQGVGFFTQVLKNGYLNPTVTSKMLRKIVKVFPDVPYGDIREAASFLHNIERFDDFSDLMISLNNHCIRNLNHRVEYRPDIDD